MVLLELFALKENEDYKFQFARFDHFSFIFGTQLMK